MCCLVNAEIKYFSLSLYEIIMTMTMKHYVCNNDNDNDNETSCI